MDKKESLYRHLAATLKKAEKGRKAVAITKIPVYFLTFLFFCFIVFNLVTMGRYSARYEDFNVVGGVMGLAFAVMFFQMFFLKALKSFHQRESEAMKKIMKAVFPEGKFQMPYYGLSYKTLKKSRLFSGFNREGAMPATTFAGVETTVGDHTLKIADIGLSTGKTGEKLGGIPLIGPFFTMFRTILLPLFSRPDRAVYGFRGMFAWAEFEKEFKGTVVVLPDKLEPSLGYLAQSLQSLKNIDGSRLVVMEDPEFERHFAVYADDEVAARYILTPAMMRRITALKEKFGRDMFLSFNGNGFYFAVHMPEGFLSVRPSALKGKSLIDEIEEDVRTACDAMKELNLINR